ncbi:hypothetical protein [Paractinoplanes rishiriensis]|nr:hypothetical protein [Actinoplanes rishiriensis]
MVAVIGGRRVNIRDSRTLEFAEAVGRELALLGYGVATGGDDGVGGAACKGAVEAGGVTLAFLKEAHIDNCSPYVTWALPTSLDLSRSVPLNWAGCAIVAFDGGFGTLFEIALALDTSRPLVLTGDQPLLRTEKLQLPTCERVMGNDPASTPEVIAALRKLIGPPPVPSAPTGNDHHRVR